MDLNNRNYIIYALAALVFVVAVYLIYFYQAPVSVAVSMTPLAQTQNIFPYQKIPILLNVSNTGGGGISKLQVALYVGNNITAPYSLTVPQGKYVQLLYNFTPTRAGTYNIRLVADPSRLDNVVDRSTASYSLNLVVNKEDAPNTGRYVLGNNVSTETDMQMNGEGFAILSYLAGGYYFNQLPFWNATPFAGYFLPLFNITQQYIDNISLTYATYKNGSYALSLWSEGYLAPRIIPVFASAAHLEAHNTTVGDKNVTIVNMTNASICSWYENGWIKSIATSRGLDCASFIGNNFTASGSEANVSLPHINNSVDVGHYRVKSPSFTKLGKVIYAGSAYVIDALSNGSAVGSNACLGVLTNLNGSTYCSIYLVPKAALISSVALFKTTKLSSLYNATLFVAINSTHIVDAIATNVQVLKAFNISGTPVDFVSGFENTCAFNASIGCDNMTFLNSSIAMRIHNNLTKDIYVKSIECYSTAPNATTAVDTQIAAGTYANVSAMCYNGKSKIPGVPLGLTLHMRMDYAEGNATRMLNGTAYLNIIAGGQ